MARDRYCLLHSHAINLLETNQEISQVKRWFLIYIHQIAFLLEIRTS